MRDGFKSRVFTGDERSLCTPRSRGRSSIRGRSRCACRRRAATSCSRAGPTRARSGIRRSTTSRPRIEFDVKGTYVSHHERKEGIGAPTVAIGRGENAGTRRKTSPFRKFTTASPCSFASKGGARSFAFEDPLATERVNFGGHSFPLAADFTVPIAVLLASTNPKKLELTRLLRPDKYAETARISRLQALRSEQDRRAGDPRPHGFARDVDADDQPPARRRAIRRNYQFWFYSYPSGYPYPHSAAILRRELDAIGKRFPLHKKMVVIGHSMGGCISRLLMTDTGDKIWMGDLRQATGAGADVAGDQEARHRRDDLPAPAGNRPRHLHLRAAARAAISRPTGSGAWVRAS